MAVIKFKIKKHWHNPRFLKPVLGFVLQAVCQNIIQDLRKRFYLNIFSDCTTIGVVKSFEFELARCTYYARIDETAPSWVFFDDIMTRNLNMVVLNRRPLRFQDDMSVKR